MADVRSLGDVVESELRRLQTNQQPTGLPSGLDLERRVPGGIPRDKVTTVFAEAGNFKTTFKNHLLISMAERGHRVLDVSLEDSSELSAHRYLARLSGVPYGLISGGVMSEDQVGQLGVSKLAKDVADRVLVVDNIDPTVDNIFRCALEHRVEAVAVDYIQLISGHGSMKDRLDDLMIKAQKFAKRQRIAPIFISQQKQGNERDEKDDPRPKVGDGLGSSAMRIGSKLLLGLFRPAKYCPVPSNPKGPYGVYARFLSANPAHSEIYPQLIECWVLKNVLGAEAPVMLRVQPETGVMCNADEVVRPYI